MTWTLSRHPSAPSPAEFVVCVGGYRFLARWNDLDGRWFNGYQKIDPRYVRAYYELPECPEGE